MAGQKFLSAVLFLGIELSVLAAPKPSTAIPYGPEDVRPIVIDVLLISESTSLNSSTNSPPDNLAFKLQQLNNSQEEMKETVMLSLALIEHQLRSILKEFGALRVALMGNQSRTTDVAGAKNSTGDTINTGSFDIAAKKARLATSWNEWNANKLAKEESRATSHWIFGALFACGLVFLAAIGGYILFLKYVKPRLNSRAIVTDKIFEDTVNDDFYRLPIFCTISQNNDDLKTKLII